jgi:hypothetical protein
MTSGSRLEKVGSLRLVEGFHGVQAYSRVFLAPSYYSPGPPWQWGEWCPGRFLERFLSEVFTWRRCPPLWSDEVDELASTPCTGLRCITTYRGDRACLRGAVWSCCGEDARCCIAGYATPVLGCLCRF